jgi:hypothetical protein
MKLWGVGKLHEAAECLQVQHPTFPRNYLPYLVTVLINTSCQIRVFSCGLRTNAQTNLLASNIMGAKSLVCQMYLAHT